MSDVSPPTVSPLQVQAIRQRINAGAPLDSLIIELARQQEAIDELALKLRLLKSQQQLADVLLPAISGLEAGVAEAQLDAGLPLDPDKGFYGMEYDGNGHPFRWTGPAPVFSFDLHLDRREALSVSLYVATGFGEISDRLRAFSDGAELPLMRRTVAGGAEHQLVLLPRRFPGLTRLSFLVPRMFQAAPGSTDQRVLGVVFRRLEVHAAGEHEVRSYLESLDDLRRQSAASLATPTPVVPEMLAGVQVVAAASPEVAGPALADMPKGVGT